MPLTRCLELRIPPGELLELPLGWAYGQQSSENERILIHDSGRGVVVTEAETDETVDAALLREVLETALSDDNQP